MSKHPVVRVTDLQVLHDRVVRVHFDDGITAERDLSPLLTGPVFEQIRVDDTMFRQVAVDTNFGVISWPNGADIDAELLRYDNVWRQTIVLNSPW